MTYTPNESRTGWGWVYLQTHVNANGLHKIGLTRHPEQRLEQLGGEDCTVICRVLSSNPEALEAQLHGQFADKRLPQTEYFDLSDLEVGDCVATMQDAHAEATRFAVRPGMVRTQAWADQKALLEQAEAKLKQLTPVRFVDPPPGWTWDQRMGRWVQTGNLPTVERTRVPVMTNSHSNKPWRYVMPGEDINAPEVKWLPGCGWCKQID